MDRPLTLWARLTLRLGLVLAAIGILPALAEQLLFPGFGGALPALLLLSVMPLALLVLAAAAILYLAVLVRRLRGPS